MQWVYETEDSTSSVGVAATSSPRVKAPLDSVLGGRRLPFNVEIESAMNAANSSLRARRQAIVMEHMTAENAYEFERCIGALSHQRRRRANDL